MSAYENTPVSYLERFSAGLNNVDISLIKRDLGPIEKLKREENI